MGWKHHKFPIETLKTSDFFAPNLGCLCCKPRYFSSQKSDVFGFRTLFYAEIPGFSPFLPRNPQSPTLVFSPPVPHLLGSEALLSAPKSQIILTKSPASSSRRETRKTHFLGIQSWHGNYIPLTTMCFFLMTLRAERFTSKSLVLVERQKP